MTARAVLLTGATGSLGGHVCAALLNHTAVTVHCLVRAHDNESARARLEQRLRTVEDMPAGRQRVLVHACDLEEPGLGMDPDDLDVLAENIDTVIHCAAKVNLAADYDDLAAANLTATGGLIALAERSAALTGRAPAFHHVSTIGVLVAAQRIGLAEVDESTQPSADTTGGFGYPASKAAAEQALRAAAGRGLPVAIYRPGLVMAHSRTGRTSTSDLLLPIVRAAISLGLAPEAPDVIPADSVDVVARAVALLAVRPDTPGRVFHLTRPDPLPLAGLFDSLRRAGHRLTPVPAGTWWDQVEGNAADAEVLPMVALREIGRYLVPPDPRYCPPRIGSTATWDALRAAGMTPPPLDGAYFDRFAEATVPLRRDEELASSSGGRAVPVTGGATR
ncbi:hypothetical protein ADK60_37105 [Streptomyces sp. XY431]|uniref:thioester reductase domain-containing protein n=1 Tax=Streptomyces sp. XY431 TaxID=1415562 RepID=UPI0006AFD690|nr:thioester reductase domain-containing protein [Streptomyces sp. XY431]KOV10761.1 hypothetical protein ADK60_37105 [Streptomyces sp. XY431]